ncbi:MAG: hypothetical protein AB7L28_29225, partial [Kofleriaceae bacterium]
PSCRTGFVLRTHRVRKPHGAKTDRLILARERCETLHLDAEMAAYSGAVYLLGEVVGALYSEARRSSPSEIRAQAAQNLEGVQAGEEREVQPGIFM